MASVDVQSAPTCSITWSWDAETKTWLVEAFSLRDGGRRRVARCHVLRSDPLPDHQLANLMHALVDYWAAGFLF